MGNAACGWTGSALALVLVTSAAPAAATGMIGHIYVSELALERLPAGELRSVLEERQSLWENGSFFPDSGYAAGDPYGELAHWAEFVEAYLQWIRSNHTPPYTTGGAADHVAVLMGAASHGMVDQTFDILFWDRVAAVDGDASELDTGMDAWLVADRDRHAAEGVHIDAVALAELFGTHLDHVVTPTTIAEGMDTAIMGQKVVELMLAPGDKFRDDMPWGAGSYLDPEVPGSYPWSAEVVWRYWQNLWRRLHGDLDLAESVIGTHPSSAGPRLAVNHESLDSYVTVFVGHGIDRDSIDAQTVRVEEADGQVVPTQIRLRGDRWAGTIQLQPMGDWAYETTYSLIVEQVVTLNGEPLTSPFRLDFRTECAPGNEAACSPPDPAPPTAVGEGSEGCQMATSAPPGLPWWLLTTGAPLLLRRFRRRR
ncbi:MAG: hypothetical protein JRI68_28890 [Deltaproteobacteria bacterium]|nr:hypothetical protein [Deltaproteobacteria bacterium]